MLATSPAENKVKGVFFARHKHAVGHLHADSIDKTLPRNFVVSTRYIMCFERGMPHIAQGMTLNDVVQARHCSMRAVEMVFNAKPTRRRSGRLLV
jgi:hypothetical protein